LGLSGVIIVKEKLGNSLWVPLVFWERTQIPFIHPI